MGTFAKFLTRGLEASLPTTPIESGKLRYTVDAGRCYLDYLDPSDNQLKRVRISDIVDNLTEAQILAKTSGIYPKIYIAKDSGAAYYNANGKWVKIGPATLKSDSTNSDRVLWFSAADGSGPMYKTALTYNPGTETLKVKNLTVSGTLKVGSLTITDTVDANSDHIFDFKLA